ncbi:pYEATS domain-containing protein [Spirosoma aerophilum]
MKDDNPKTEVFKTQQASENTTKIIKKLLLSVGFRRDRSYILETTDISFARVGLDSLNREVILVNPKDISTANEFCSNTAILAHELGHIFGRHLIDSVITSRHELDADYYSGFVTRKLKECSDISVVKAPFKEFIEDAQHPAFSVREKEIEQGWNDASPSALVAIKLPSKGIAKFVKKDSLADLFLTVTKITPPVNRNDLKFRVIMSIKSQEKFLSQEEIFSSIKKVRYYLHHTMDKNPIPWFYAYKTVKKGINNIDFSHTILVWGDFPIKAKIFFTDGSTLKIKKVFHL